MKPRVIRPANHEEWLKEREHGVGASEVGAILGLSPFETPFSLWLKKTKQVEPEPENLAMRMGHVLEPIVVQLWEEATGEKVIKASAADIIYVHPEYDFMRATPDRIVRGRKKIVECKTTVTDVDKNDIYPYWIAQCEYQMLVTGIHDCDLSWLVKGRYFDYANIPYDQEFAEFLAEKVKEFWNENVLGGKEPDLISVTDFAMKESDPGTTIEADEEAISHIMSTVELNAEIATAETALNAHKDAVKLYMGEAEALTVNGKPIATWKSGTRGRTFLLKNRNIEELQKDKDNVSE